MTERGTGLSGPVFQDAKTRSLDSRSSRPLTGATMERRAPQPWQSESWHCPQCTLSATSVGMQQDEQQKGGGLCSSTAAASTAQKPC